MFPGVINQALDLSDETTVSTPEPVAVVTPPPPPEAGEQSDDGYSDDNLSDSTWDDHMSSYR